MSLTLSTLAPPSLQSGTHRPRRGTGILLNSTTSYYNNQSYYNSTAPPYLPPSSPSSTSSASQSASEDSGKGKSPSRRIHFAPLPKPRQNSNEGNNTNDGTPIIVIDEGDDDEADSNNQLQITVEDTTETATYSKRSSWGYSTKKLLRPFYQPLKKAKDQLDTEGGIGGSALGLFRPNSRDSTASSQGTLTDTGNNNAPLKRRMSTGSTPFSLGPNNHIVRTTPNSLALAPVTSENGGVAAGTRMLNGRIYGGSRVKQVKKEVPVEPEFVEWGYGGMGSNSASTANSTYAKLQSSHKNVVAATNEDEDDGSGMGWVRKRREQREKEKKEREEREMAAKLGDEQQQPRDEEKVPETIQEAAQASSSSLDTLPDVQGPTIADSITQSPQQHPASPPAPAPEVEHVTQTFTIPVRSNSGHYHPKPRNSLGSMTPVSGHSTPMARHNSYESGNTITSPLTAIPVEEGDESSESSESDSGEGSTEKEDDDDDEESAEEICRKTSACAGVEKISRHKE
ncbi:hypothetical protein FRB95_011413 [Tulasnella sp. JGI-2019a]|nr:hypothetical protein FRB95_011413 [Tulasnella sp. JGI-2019a]